MDIKVMQKKWFDFIKKYRFAALVLAIGLLLMLLPTKTKQTDNKTSIENHTAALYEDPCQRLSEILSRVEGAGEVEILLTVATGEETVFQTNDDISSSEANNTSHKTTVTINSADKNQEGLIKQINPPKYLGAIVVCEGADSPSVRLAIVDAVAKVTGLGSDRVSVLKMK